MIVSSDGSFVLPDLWWKFSNYLYTLKVIVPEPAWLPIPNLLIMSSVHVIASTVPNCKVQFIPLSLHIASVMNDGLESVHAQLYIMYQLCVP